MNRGTALAIAGLAGVGLLGTAAFVRRSNRRALSFVDHEVIPLITPVIDLRIAENVLAAMERMSGENVTVIIHTQGGCVASCVMIAKAVAQFQNSHAVVPYMAISGGTMIALSASNLSMGRNAALSAVDPIVMGQRAKNIEDGDNVSDHALGALAREYHLAVGAFLRETLARRLEGSSTTELDAAVSVFMGENRPHEWPISSEQVSGLGIAVSLTEPRWAPIVDEVRRRWW